MAEIRILLNGETRKVPGEIKLDDLLELFSLPRQRVAVELNDQVISRNDWSTTAVAENDKIEVVHFVGGG